MWLNSDKDIENNKESGVAAVEFALGFLAFFMMIVLFIEISYMSYISAVTDLMISKASRQSKLYSESEDFISVFESTLNSDGDIWRFLVSEENFRFSIRYLEDFDSLSNVEDACLPTNEDGDSTNGVCGEAAAAPIAIYRISYHYSPIFDFYPDSFFTREVISIQEYQRDAFGGG